LERHGYAFGARRVDVLAAAPRASLGDRVAQALDGAGATATRAVLEHPYYSGGLRYMLCRQCNRLPRRPRSSTTVRRSVAVVRSCTSPLPEAPPLGQLLCLDESRDTRSVGSIDATNSPRALRDCSSRASLHPATPSCETSRTRFDPACTSPRSRDG